MKVPFTNYNYASNVSVVARYPIVLKFDRTSFGTSMGIKIGINEGEERIDNQISSGLSRRLSEACSSFSKQVTRPSSFPRERRSNLEERKLVLEANDHSRSAGTGSHVNQKAYFHFILESILDQAFFPTSFFNRTLNVTQLATSRANYFDINITEYISRLIDTDLKITTTRN